MHKCSWENFTLSGVSGGSGSTIAADSSDILTDLKIKSSNHEYARDIALGIDASLPYKRVTITNPRFDIGSGRISFPSLGYYREQKGFSAPVPYRDMASVLPISSLDSQCYVKMLNKVRDELVAFSTPTFISELREVISMLRHPVSSLRSSLNKYLSKMSKYKGKKVNPIADTWLEYSFGWSPLVSDIGNLMDALSRLHTVPKSIRCMATSKLPIKFVERGPADTFSIPLDYALHLNGNYSVRYTGLFKRRQDSNFAANMSLFGISWAELAPTAWELIPWSFLLDYFSNIGDAVEANVTLGQVQKVYLSKSHKYFYKGTCDVALRASSLGSAKVSGFVPQHDEVYVSQFERFGPLDLILAIPSVDVSLGLSFRKMLNLAALAKNRF